MYVFLLKFNNHWNFGLFFKFVVMPQFFGLGFEGSGMSAEPIFLLAAKGRRSLTFLGGTVLFSDLSGATGAAADEKYLRTCHAKLRVIHFAFSRLYFIPLYPVAGFLLSPFSCQECWVLWEDERPLKQSTLNWLALHSHKLAIYSRKLLVMNHDLLLCLASNMQELLRYARWLRSWILSRIWHGF